MIRGEAELRCPDGHCFDVGLRNPRTNSDATVILGLFAASGKASSQLNCRSPRWLIRLGLSVRRSRARECVLA